MKVRITIESTHVIDVERFDDATRRYISEHYQVADLPYEYQDSEFEDGSITFEVIG